MAYTKITNFAIKDSTNDIIKGTEFDDEFNSIEASFTAQPSATQTLTNKTVALGSNTVSGTFAQFNTAVTDAELARTDAANTFTGTQTFGDVTTTGNTILGNASTDTLNVGNGDLIKDASGNLGLGVTPSAWGSTYKAVQVGIGSSFTGMTNDVNLNLANNARFDGTNWIYLANSPAERYRIWNGQHQWFTSASGTAGNTISFTQAMTLDASGGLKTLNTIGVGNATPSTSGSGITFPATQSASTDANCLDDYEEGDWTPVPTAGTGSITSYTSTGKYTKVGRMITCNCFVNITNNGSGSVNGYIAGLPFAPASAGATSCTRDYSATAKIGIVQFLTGAVSGYVIATDGTYPWATGSTFNFSFSYQI